MTWRRAEMFQPQCDFGICRKSYSATEAGWELVQYIFFFFKGGGGVAVCILVYRYLILTDLA